MKSNLKRYGIVLVAVLFVSLSTALTVQPRTAYAAACTAPGTDYGTVTLSLSATSAGTYRIWSRMSAPSSSANTYLLDIDSTSCYTVGGSSVPVYTNGTSTYFTNNASNWIAKTSGGAFIDVTLSSGAHTIKQIGNATGVVVDRLIATKDTTCTPTGTGDNCASIYLAPDINQDGNVGFLDFSALSSKYNQSSGSLGRVDINHDGTVNFLDFSLLASKYGQ